MDWLPSGLILKDPVWIIFFGSTWEMAHSISSTRALQAVWSRDGTHIKTAMCIVQIKEQSGRTHTATLHVLSLSGRLDEAQEVKQKQRRQQSAFPHLAPTGHSTYFDHITRLTHQTLLISEQQLDLRLENDVLTQRAQFVNFSLNLRVPGRDSRSHRLRFSTLFHHIR